MFIWCVCVREMKHEAIRLSYILKFFDERIFFSIRESSLNEKGTCTLTSLSTLATSNKGRMVAGLEWVEREGWGPMLA